MHTLTPEQRASVGQAWVEDAHFWQGVADTTTSARFEDVADLCGCHAEAVMDALRADATDVVEDAVVVTSGIGSHALVSSFNGRAVVEQLALEALRRDPYREWALFAVRVISMGPLDTPGAEWRAIAPDGVEWWVAAA